MPLSIIHSDPALLNGTPVFRGTRVPVESLFMHLEKGVSVAEFLADFPSVTAEQVRQVLAGPLAPGPVVVSWQEAQ